MPAFVLNPYVWLTASAVLIAFGFIAASGWGSWGRR